MARRFNWISLAEEPPEPWDLRRAGWTMLAGEDSTAPLLLDAREGTAPDVSNTPTRRVAVLGVDSPARRAELLTGGFGEALAADIDLAELAARVERMADNASRLSRETRAGPVTLDLFHRDGRVEDRWLGLHPREFALLWHLAETKGQVVSRADLLMAVWRLKHDPGTNSLEVHVSRLRTKLNAAGVKGLIETDPAGGYRLKG